MKLLIQGSNGLLGNTLTKYFFEKSNHKTYGYLRDSSKLRFFGTFAHKLIATFTYSE